MKYLTKREEIGKAMNFGKYPILYIDLDKPHSSGSDFYKGSKCRIAWDMPDGRYKGMSARCVLYRYNGKYEFSQQCVCLKDSFGREDIIKDMNWANVPVLHCGQTVVLIEDHSIQGVCAIRMMKTGEQKDIHCSTVTHLEDIDQEVKV